jgi:hypothetical protein
MTAVRPRLIAVTALVWLFLSNLGLAADPA